VSRVSWKAVIGITIAFAVVVLWATTASPAGAHHKLDHGGGPVVLPGPPAPDKGPGQGNSPSAPDQDGKGPDRNNPVQEEDTDGNNGNGNDADRCDDDEGNNPQCLSNPSPSPSPSPTPSESPSPTPSETPSPTPSPTIPSPTPTPTAPSMEEEETPEEGLIPPKVVRNKPQGPGLAYTGVGDWIIPLAFGTILLGATGAVSLIVAKRRRGV
jgi:hypothetical protein